jgi:hypothetical protein
LPWVRIVFFVWHHKVPRPGLGPWTEAFCERWGAKMVIPIVIGARGPRRWGIWSCFMVGQSHLFAMAAPRQAPVH